MAVKDNSTVRWFTSDMAGAPVLTTDPGSIIAILDACLINGFGTDIPDGDKITVSGGVATVHFSGGNTFEEHSVIEITGASVAALNDVWRVTGATATTFEFNAPGLSDGAVSGGVSVKRATPGYWEKTFGDSLVGAYRSIHPESTGMYLRVDDSLPRNDTAGVPVRGYQSMTDIDNGMGEFPTFASHPVDNINNTAMWMRPYNRLEHSNPGHWTLIADERFFWFLPSIDYNTGGSFFQFGDIAAPASLDLYNCVISGHYKKPVRPTDFTSSHRMDLYASEMDSFAATHDGAVQGTGYTRRSFPNMRYTMPNTMPQPNPHPLTVGLLLNPIWAYDGTYLWRGRVPGIWQILNDMDQYLPDEENWEIKQSAIGIDQHLMIVRMGSDNTSRASSFYAGFDISGPWR